MTAPLRYLLIATHVPASGSGGGIVRYTVDLAEALTRRDDVELHLAVTPGAAAHFCGSVPAERLHRMRGTPTVLRSLLERSGMVPGVRELDFDVVHGVKHIVPRRARGATVVLTVHDMLLLDRPADFRPAKRFLLRRPYLGSIRDADVLLCVSRATDARVRGYLSSVHDRTRVVPPAVSGSLVDADEAPVDALAGRRFALVVGDASARKNLRLAVDTWPDVRAAVPEAVLAVVGPPDWGRSHRGSAWESEVATGSIVPLGHIPDASLRWCYENCSVVLCPSLLEGFGLPAAEAARFGAPIVVSDDPAMREAAGGRAMVVARGDRAGWVRAVLAGLSAERRTPPVGPRTWDDVAEETVEAVRRVRRDGHGAQRQG